MGFAWPVVRVANALTVLTGVIELLPDRGDVASSNASSTPETWTVWRQDDLGNQFVVSSGHSREEAERIVRELEARRHKQMYWASRDRPG